MLLCAKTGGTNLSAIVSGGTEHGIFCELENTVEGFVPVEKLGGEFTYNPQRFCLVGNGARYALGDKIDVVVDSVNMQTFKINFLLAKNIDLQAKTSV